MVAQASKFPISKVFFVLWLLVLCTEVYFLIFDIPLLQKDTPTSYSFGKKEPIAELMKHKNSVQLQEPGDIVWNPVSSGQTLHEKEKLLTQSNAIAEVAFADGSGLVVDEESMVLLSRKTSDALGSKIVINLLRGSLHKKASTRQKTKLATAAPAVEEIAVETGGTELKFKPATEFSITASPEFQDANKIVVHKGELDVKTPSGAVKVQPGEEVTVSKEATAAPPKVKKVSLQLIYPQSGDIVGDQSDQPISFSWKADLAGKSNQNLVLEIAPDKNFSADKTQTQSVSGNQHSLKLDRKRRAKYFWRIRTDDKKSISTAASFWVDPIIVPQLIAPDSNIEVDPESDVRFIWKNISESKSYELELGGVETKKFESDSPTYFLEKIPEGNYYWRIRATLKNGQVTPWSERRKISAFEEEAPPPPDSFKKQKFLPKDKKKPQSNLHKFWNWILPAAHAENINNWSWDVVLGWGEVPKIKRYKIQVARTRAFKKIIADEIVDQPEYTYKYKLGHENSKGRLYYRVASVTRSGKVGGFSQPKTIYIPQNILALKNKDKPKPKEKPKFDLAKAEAEAKKREAAKRKKQEAEEQARNKKQAKDLAEWRRGLKEDPIPPSIELKGGFSTGVGRSYQTSSATDLTSVNMTSPHLQNKLNLAVDLIETSLTKKLPIGLRLYSTFASFKSTTGAKSRPLTFRMDSIYYFQPRLPLRWGVGATFDRPFRWIKSADAFNVEPHAGFSFGPTAYATWKNWKYMSYSAWLSLPFSGLLTNDFYGVKANVAGEWRVWKINPKMWITIESEFEFQYVFWKSPNSTSHYNWVFWLAPTFHWELL